MPSPNSCWTNTRYTRKNLPRRGLSINLKSHPYNGSEGKVLSRTSGGWMRVRIIKPSAFCNFPVGTIIKIQDGPTRAQTCLIPSSKHHIIARVSGTTEEFVNNFLKQPFAVVYLDDGTEDPFHKFLVQEARKARLMPPLLQRQNAFGTGFEPTQ